MECYRATRKRTNGKLNKAIKDIKKLKAEKAAYIRDLSNMHEVVNGLMCQLGAERRVREDVRKQLWTEARRFKTNKPASNRDSGTTKKNHIDVVIPECPGCGAMFFSCSWSEKHQGYICENCNPDCNSGRDVMSEKEEQEWMEKEKQNEISNL